jgi:predicted nucleotidyltransferase
MKEIIPDKLQVPMDKIDDFCHLWQIIELALFGSVLCDDFKPDSDIDVLVMFTPDATWSLLDHIRMEQELKSLFEREVDLASKRAIQKSENWIYRREILTTVWPIYISR